MRGPGSRLARCCAAEPRVVLRSINRLASELTRPSFPLVRRVPSRVWAAVGSGLSLCLGIVVAFQAYDYCRTQQDLSPPLAVLSAGVIEIIVLHVLFISGPAVVRMFAGMLGRRPRW